MSEPELIPFKHPRPFHVTPEEILDRMHYAWLGNLEDGHSPIVDTLIGYLEMEAVHRFKREISMAREWEPKITDGYEDWRLFWLKEALHNSTRYNNTLGVAGNHLSTIGQAAINVMLAASALRDAISNGKAELASALGIMLICEAIQGGYSLEVEAMRQTQEAIVEAKKTRVKKTIGKTYDDLDLARRTCVHWAGKRWEADPTLRIGQVASECREKLLENLPQLATFTAQDVPEIDTIKAWFKEAAAAKKLTIPEGAQKPGRPPKTTGK